MKKSSVKKYAKTKHDDLPIKKEREITKTNTRNFNLQPKLKI